MIIGLALIESLVIYALVIAFMLTGKVDNVGDATTNAVGAQNAAELTHSTNEMEKDWENEDAQEKRDEQKEKEREDKDD